MNKFLLISVVMAGVLVAGGAPSASAQRYPERRLIREGNRNYSSQDYQSGEENYRKAVAANPESPEAQFNLSDALYKNEKYDEAAQILTALAESPALNDAQKATVYHNLGNVRFAQQRLQEALECYKESLRKEPGDRETKYNLAYVQELLRQQQEQQEQQDDNNQNDRNDGNDNPEGDNDRNDSDNNNDNNDNNDDGEQQNNDQQDRQGDPEQNDGERQEDNGNADSRQQPRAGEISREDAENILNAIQQQEDRTQEKVNEQRQVSVGRSGKNW